MTEVNFAPTSLTSNYSPPPYKVTASTSYSGVYEAFCAFGGGSASCWLGAIASTPVLSINLSLPLSKSLSSYTIQVNNASQATRAPKDWTMAGSLNGTSWSTLDTVTGETGWGNAESRNYVCDSPSSVEFQYYKLTFTANNGDTYVQVASLLLYNSSPPANPLVDFAPHSMSGSSTPSPYVASASSEYYSRPAYMAFDGTSVTWLATASTGWLKIDVGAANAQTLHSYSMTMEIPEIARAAKNWTIQGSTDNTNWDTLDTVTGETGWSSTGETRYYICKSPTSTNYRYFKVNVTLNNGDAGYSMVSELFLYHQNAAPAVLPGYPKVMVML